MSQTYLQMFKDQFYPVVFMEAAKKTIVSFGENEERIVESWRRELSLYLERIAALQQKEQAGPVAEITVSFMYTSLYEGKAVFRVDSYGDEGRVYGESMAAAFLSADWLVQELPSLKEELAACAAREGLRGVVRPAAFEVLALRAVRSLLYYFAGRFKYIVTKVLDEKYLARLKKGEVFVICIGEYLDWQNTVFAILPEVDIFNCGRDTKLQFRHFPAIVYRRKQFTDLNLSQSKFTDCTFEDVVIGECCMNDCTFDGCSFNRVTISGTQMAGSLFIDCVIREAKFEEVVFCGDGVRGHEAEYFAPVEFVGCTFSQADFNDCRLGGVNLTECEASEVVISSGDAAGSDFIKMEGVFVRQRSGEEADGVF